MLSTLNLTTYNGGNVASTTLQPRVTANNVTLNTHVYCLIHLRSTKRLLNFEGAQQVHLGYLG